MKPNNFLLTLSTVLIVNSIVHACGAGVPRIENGVWANKDSIYANCEKCYAGNEKEIRDCKALYNRTAEDQIVTIEQQKAEALSQLPDLIKKAKRSNVTDADLCYFPRKYPGCEKSRDTLELLLGLKSSKLSEIPVRDLVKYKSFLVGLEERQADLRQFQNILLSRPKELHAKDVTLTIMGMIVYGRITDRIVDVNHWLYLFARYSAFVQGCREYADFKNLAESNPLLYAIFVSQEECGTNNRVLGSSDWMNVSYESVKKSIDACLKLEGEEKKIAYGNDYLYDQSVGNTMWALTRLYEKEVLGAITDTERKQKEELFLSKVPLTYVRPILDALVKYERHVEKKLAMGTQMPEMYLKLKRIYKL